MRVKLEIWALRHVRTDTCRLPIIRKITFVASIDLVIYFSKCVCFSEAEYLLQIRISRKINITHYAFQKQESAFSSNLTELQMLDNSSSQTTHVQ